MYRFYLDGVLLPITPSQLKVKIENKNQTATLINDGEINILKLPGLSGITFSALLPNTYYPFAMYESGIQFAQYYLDKLEKLKTDTKVFKFEVVRMGTEVAKTSTNPFFDTSFTVALEDYVINEDASKFGADVSVDISLLQYKPYATKIITFQTAADGKKTASTTETRDTSTKPAETTYAVVKGDNLWSIAKKKLGNGSRSTEIYNLNKEVIEATAKKYGKASSSNGWWIYPGTVLKLPTA